MQLVERDVKLLRDPPADGIRVTWLGHAGLLYQFDNINILCNPNLNKKGMRYWYPRGGDLRYR